jgi:hypothetical protein
VRQLELAPDSGGPGLFGRGGGWTTQQTASAAEITNAGAIPSPNLVSTVTVVHQSEGSSSRAA